MLPVNILALDGTCEGERHKISWTTAAEINNEFFTLLTSTDGVHYEALAKIPGSGNSSSLKHYSYTVPESREHKMYYQLQQTDYDGKKQTLKTVYVSCAQSNDVPSVKIYPNPSKGIFFIETPLQTQRIEIINLHGQIVFSKNVGQHMTLINAEHLKLQGMYFLVLYRDEEVVSEKMYFSNTSY